MTSLTPTLVERGGKRKSVRRRTAVTQSKPANHHQSDSQARRFSLEYFQSQASRGGKKLAKKPFAPKATILSARRI
jgi:hypothetical protein